MVLLITKLIAARIEILLLRNEPLPSSIVCCCKSYCQYWLNGRTQLMTLRYRDWQLDELYLTEKAGGIGAERLYVILICDFDLTSLADKAAGILPSVRRKCRVC